MRKGQLIVLSGFSGSGKGTLIKRLLEKSDAYALSVSMTTRSPRQGERDGVEYFFVTREHFEEVIAQNGLIEYAEYVGNYYGTPRAYVEQQLSLGKNVLLEIEVQGGAQIRKQFPEAVLVFVCPPSAKELYKRLTGRGTETEEVVRNRMAQAAREIQAVQDYDYILINDDLDKCIEEFEAIVLTQGLKVAYNTNLVHQLAKEFDELS